jgi:putative hydrolase of the HAD superfamily
VTHGHLPHVILLDLDDTIVDDSSSVDTGWQTCCAEAATETNGLEAAALLRSIHEVRDWYWSDAERHRVGRLDLRASSTWIVDEALRRLGFEASGLGAVIANRYRDLREQDIALLPGAIETIEALRQAGVALGLLTNGGALGQRAKIERFDLARHFDFIAIEGEAGYGKPDERVYRAALQALDCAPSDAWMVGDNLEWDVLAPMRLGLRGVWLDRFAAGLPVIASGTPDRVILALTELLSDS